MRFRSSSRLPLALQDHLDPLRQRVRNLVPHSLVLSTSSVLILPPSLKKNSPASTSDRRCRAREPLGFRRGSTSARPGQGTSWEGELRRSQRGVGGRECEEGREGGWRPVLRGSWSTECGTRREVLGGLIACIARCSSRVPGSGIREEEGSEQKTNPLWRGRREIPSSSSVPHLEDARLQSTLLDPMSHFAFSTLLLRLQPAVGGRMHRLKEEVDYLRRAEVSGAQGDREINGPRPSPRLLPPLQSTAGSRSWAGTCE